MPTSDGEIYSFKYVNGHPKNMAEGLQTVTAFGLLADVSTGYPVLLTEMTLLTALRTAATSAMAARHLAPKGATTMAMIGNGAQAEFQALAMKAVLGVTHVRLFDIDRRRRKRPCAISRVPACMSQPARPHRPQSRVPRSSRPALPTSSMRPSSPTTWSGRRAHQRDRWRLPRQD